ncbi:MAG: threonylcarbamoyl-AMP synthase [Clostridia bacterium]|nr:threonylcarbamoyl-AMP synthase [Clostridia bacterium]
MIKKYKQNQIEELANILKNDGVICVPTDTVYGVCARMNSEKAHDRLIEIKNRPLNKLFPIMCADEEQIKNIAIVNKKAEALINKFMPGPITLILEKQIKLLDSIDNEYTKIAIRMATSKILEQLIQKVENPIFMTSANISGEPTCQTLEEVEKAFPTLDGILEGEVPKGQSSTILDCTSEEIKILRQGPITLEQIEKALNKNV